MRGESADIFFVLPGFEDDAYWDDAKGKSDVDVRDVDAAAHPRVQHLQFKEARLARGDCVVVPATTVYWVRDEMSLPTLHERHTSDTTGAARPSSTGIPSNDERACDD